MKFNTSDVVFAPRNIDKGTLAMKLMITMFLCQKRNLLHTQVRKN